MIALTVCIIGCDFVVVLSMCLLYVSLRSRVSPSILGLMFMGSVMSICSSNCVLYSTESSVKIVHEVSYWIENEFFLCLCMYFLYV